MKIEPRLLLPAALGVGAGLVTAGVWMIATPAGLIVLGLFLIVAAVEYLR